MSVFTRVAIFACLAIALVQPPLPGRSGPAADGAVPEAEVVRVPNVPHPASSGVRTYLPDVLSLDFGSATFASAPAGEIDVGLVVVSETLRVRPGAGLDAAVLLPPSRAPPTLS